MSKPNFKRLCGLIVAILALPAVGQCASINDFIDFSLRSTNGALLLPGRLYVPPDAASPADPHPLIVFLHGAGESGTNNVAQINQNVDNLLAEAKQRGAYLYAPQTNSGWGPATITNHTMTMVDRALSDLNVDRSRLYLTGLSMGGGGVWNMLHRFPDRFAAAVPICAVSPASDFLSASLMDDAVWAFHARNDTVVSMNTTRNVVNGILRAAREPIPSFPPSTDATTLFHFDSPRFDLHYTEPATGGHGIWTPVYAYEQMYDWLFAHAIPEPASVALLAIAGMSLSTLRMRRAT